jgi:hypothetical protein
MDHVGATTALTTLSPILPERMRELKNRLRVVRYTPGLGRPLVALGFVHYARWIILEWLPPPGERGGWRGLRWKYLLFESNYDGTEPDYLRTFADILPARLAKLWGTCVGFESAAERGAHAAPTIAPFGFQSFVSRNKLDVIDFYAAYPHATAIDVSQAIGMIDRIDCDSRSEDGEDAALGRVTRIGPMALGPVPSPPTLFDRIGAVYGPWKRAVTGRYGVNPLTVVTPIPAAALDRLKTLCAKRSLLQGLCRTETHFARLAVIPPRLTDLGQANPDSLETPFLLFTSDSWGNPLTHLDSLRSALGEALDEIWGACPGYPGYGDGERARFHAWINNHTLPTRYYVAGYPPRKVTEIRSYLEQRAGVADVYAERPYPSASRLLAELDDDGD